MKPRRRRRRLPLEPGKSLTHTQDTIHLAGDAKVLDPIAKAVLGASLEEINKACAADKK